MKKMLAIGLLLSMSLHVLATVNLNTATQEQLEALKGVGPAKAKAIIEYRKKNGSFKAVDELNNVPGFGDKTLAKLKSELTVTAGSGADAKASSAPTTKTVIPTTKK